MAKVDSAKVAAAIAATEAVIEGTDPGGFGQSALRIAVNQIGAALANEYPRFDVARFEADALPLQSARMRDAILRTLEAEGKTRTAERLEYLRDQIEAESISYAELAELQGLADEIDPGDALLLEWAGVPEHAEQLEPVPADFPVQPVDPEDPNVQSLATCGDCGRSWDDAVPTSWTPAPSARCPFEYFHGPREED